MSDEILVLYVRINCAFSKEKIVLRILRRFPYSKIINYIDTESKIGMWSRFKMKSFRIITIMTDNH